METTTVNVHEAKTQLSRLLVRVEAGEEIVIARAGKPIARLMPYKPTRRVPRLGAFTGQITYAPNWLENEDWDAMASQEDPLLVGK